jgi:hypothetical protein
MTVRFLISISIAILADVCSGTEPAAPAGGRPGGPPAGWKTRVNAGIVHKFETDIDSGGALSVTRSYAGADFGGAVGKDSLLNLGFGFGVDSYDFSEIGAPWGDIMRLDASIAYTRMIDREWALRLAPSAQLTGEDGASVSESLVFGAIASASRQIDADLRLGFGIAMFTGLEETRAFPFLAVQWKISDTWTLQNPFRPGPAGPAGLELVHTDGSWEFALGGAYRSFRFRLSDDNPVAGGIGEYASVPLFARASSTLYRALQIDLYAGLLAAGRIKIEDESGRKLSSSDFDTGPLAALTLNGRF